MTDIERINRYIEKTKIKNRTQYDMYTHDIIAIAESGDFVRAIVRAYEFGRAKGFRAAKAMDR